MSKFNAREARIAKREMRLRAQEERKRIREEKRQEREFKKAEREAKKRIAKMAPVKLSVQRAKEIVESLDTAGKFSDKKKGSLVKKVMTISGARPVQIQNRAKARAFQVRMFEATFDAVMEEASKIKTPAKGGKKKK